jgi:hypothetical protein
VGSHGRTGRYDTSGGVIVSCDKSHLPSISHLLNRNTEHMYLIYRRAKNDPRSDHDIIAEARARLTVFQARGLDLGHGHNGEFRPPERIEKRMHSIYASSKRVLREEFSTQWVNRVKEMTVEWKQGIGVKGGEAFVRKGKGKGLVLQTLAGKCVMVLDVQSSCADQWTPFRFSRRIHL